jgi:hypothetical protein
MKKQGKSGKNCKNQLEEEPWEELPNPPREEGVEEWELPEDSPPPEEDEAWLLEELPPDELLE